MTVTSAQVRFRGTGSALNMTGSIGKQERETFSLTLSLQPLDNKTLSKLENAVAKSSYVGQGKKLKVTNEVRKPPIIISRHPNAGCRQSIKYPEETHLTSE